MKQAKANFSVGRQIVRKGDVVDDSDPLIKGREHLFGEVEVRKMARATPVERATAAPGEKRATPAGKPKAKAPAKSKAKAPAKSKATKPASK